MTLPTEVLQRILWNMSPPDLFNSCQTQPFLLACDPNDEYFWKHKAMLDFKITPEQWVRKEVPYIAGIRKKGNTYELEFNHYTGTFHDLTPRGYYQKLYSHYAPVLIIQTIEQNEHDSDIIKYATEDVDHNELQYAAAWARYRGREFLYEALSENKDDIDPDKIFLELILQDIDLIRLDQILNYPEYEYVNNLLVDPVYLNPITYDKIKSKTKYTFKYTLNTLDNLLHQLRRLPNKFNEALFRHIVQSEDLDQFDLNPFLLQANLNNDALIRVTNLL